MNNKRPSPQLTPTRSRRKRSKVSPPHPPAPPPSLAHEGVLGDSDHQHDFFLEDDDDQDDDYVDSSDPQSRKSPQIVYIVMQTIVHSSKCDGSGDGAGGGGDGGKWLPPFQPQQTKPGSSEPTFEAGRDTVISLFAKRDAANAAAKKHLRKLCDIKNAEDAKTRQGYYEGPVSRSLFAGTVEIPGPPARSVKVLVRRWTIKQ